MTDATELDKCLDDLSTKRYVDDKNRNIISDVLNEYKIKIDDEKVIKMMETTLDIIKKENLLKSDREKITKFKKPIMKSVNRYIEEYEDESESDSEVSESDESENDELSVDDIEKELDSKVSSYNKFTENNPMKGVKWSESRNSYRIHINDVDKYVKTIKNVRKIMKSNNFFIRLKR
jgi:hypothetical protein